MRWANVNRAELVAPGKLRLWFEGCKHHHDRPLSDMIQVVQKNPQIMVNKEYWCRECGPEWESVSDD